MTKEQNEQAAKEYAEKNERYEWQEDGSEEECAFIAGSESRQAEIDDLGKELDIVHSCLTDLFEHKYSNESERIYRIKSCLSEIEKLKNHSK